MRPAASPSLRRLSSLVVGFFATAPTPGTIGSALRIGGISSITVIVATIIFGTSLGPVALFGSMLAQWEAGRPLISRIGNVCLIGTMMTASMAIGVMVAPERLLVIPVVVTIILVTTTAYYSFLLTKGPGPLHLFYGAAIGSYFGLVQPTGWHTVEVTAFSCVLTGTLMLLCLVPDLHRPERQGILLAENAVAAYQELTRCDNVGEEQLHTGRSEAFSMVNRGWQTLQAARLCQSGNRLQRQLSEKMVEVNHRLAATVIAKSFPHVEPQNIGPAAHVLPGRPATWYLFTRGFCRNSTAWFTAWRLGLAAGVAGCITELLGLGHPYWAILTAALVLHQWVNRLATARRATHRAVGTVLGLGVVACVAVANLSPWPIVFLIVACIVGMCLLLPRNYALAIVLVTPMSLLAIEATGQGGSIQELVRDRLTETIIGAIVAVLVARLTGSRAPRRLVRAQFRETARAIGRVLDVAATGRESDPSGMDARVQLQFELLSHATVLERATSEDRSLSDWHRVEVALSDLGYASMVACWISGEPRKEAAHSAKLGLRDFESRLRSGPAGSDRPIEIEQELSRITEMLQQQP